VVWLTVGIITPTDWPGGKWIEFNDDHVTAFDPAEIANECFGGTEEVYKTHEITRVRYQTTVTKSRSAYMLIYQRASGDIRVDDMAYPSPVRDSSNRSPTGSSSGSSHEETQSADVLIREHSGEK